MNEEPEMSLDRALHILATVHTRDNDAAGFVVMMGASPEGVGWIPQGDYIKAWEVVRQHLHLQTEPTV